MFKLIYRKYSQDIRWKDELLSGLTVALALVPEAVAFAFVAGVDPFVGLYAAFFVGLITSAIGGRPGMISGATGALAVVMTAFVVLYGLQYLFAAVVLMGILQMLAGVFKLGRFIRILPHPVMLGFVNGLAIVIGKAQFGQFKENYRVAWVEGGHGEAGFKVIGDWMAWGDSALWIMVGIIFATMLLTNFLPKLTRAIPAPLVAILFGVLLVQFTPLQTKTVANVVNAQRVLLKETQIKTAEFAQVYEAVQVGEVTAVANTVAAREVEKEELGEIQMGLKAGLPAFSIPSIDFGNGKAMMAVFILALTIASIGLIESLMTLSLIDELTETKGNTTRECFGQGIANVVTGFFGGMGGCAMIGQSMININSGGRSRVSGMSAAIFLLAFIMFAPGLIGMIPVASLIGVMFMVVIATFEWSSLRLLGKVPMTDIVVIFAVSAVTVMEDLAIAVAVGVLLSAIFHAWKHSKEISLLTTRNSFERRDYALQGMLFFGTIVEFKSLFSPAEDPDEVHLSFSNSRVCDQSAIEAIHSLSARYRKLDKKLIIHELDPACGKMLLKAGDLVEGEFYSRASSNGH